MQTQLLFAAAVADCLTASGLLTATAFSIEDPTPEKATPALGILIDGYDSAHASLHSGNLVLRYEFDPDTTTGLAAAADLTVATDYLTSEAGRTALQDLLLPSSIWIRILGPTGEATTAPSGERERTHQTAIPFWIQTYL